MHPNPEEHRGQGGESLRGLKLIPSKWRYLIPPMLRDGNPLGKNTLGALRGRKPLDRYFHHHSRFYVKVEQLMFGFDFDFFWRAANAILQGQSPYSIGGFFSPYPLALLLVPFALLPFGVAYIIWTGGKLLLLAKSGNRWEFLKAILFFPVAFDLLQGQLDLLIFIIATKSNWLGVVISTLRPQLAIWIIPFLAWDWWQAKKYDQFWKSALGIIILYGISTIIEPDWWEKWLNAPKIAWQYNEQSASLFGLAQLLPFSHITVFIGISILAIFSFALLRPQNPRAFWQWVALFNPIANIYSLAILFNQVDWVVIVLGLLALPLSQVFHTNASWALIPLYLILKDRFMTQKAGYRLTAVSRDKTQEDQNEK